MPKKQQDDVKRAKRSLKAKGITNYGFDFLPEQLSFECDVPGCAPSDLNVYIEGEELVVGGKRLGVPFSGRFKFNVDRYDLTKIEAELELGVLQITIPAKPGAGIVNVPVTFVSSSV